MIKLSIVAQKYSGARRSSAASMVMLVIAIAVRIPRKTLGPDEEKVMLEPSLKVRVILAVTLTEELGHIKKEVEIR